MKYTMREMPIFDAPSRHISEYNCCMLAFEWIEKMLAANPGVAISEEMRTAIHDAAVQFIAESEAFDRRQQEGEWTAAVLTSAASLAG